MEELPKKSRSQKEQMQLDRARCLSRLGDAVADPATNLTPTSFFVVSRLASIYLNEANEAWPAAATLAAKCGLDERTVREHLDRAVVAGFLVKRRVGRMHPNVYSLCLKEENPSSDRVICAGHSREVIGSTAPVTSEKGLNKVGVLRGRTDEKEGVLRSLSADVTGRLSQRERVESAQVIGSDRPTNHIEDNHKEEPRHKARDARTGARTRPCSSDSCSTLKLETDWKGQTKDSEIRFARVLNDEGEDASAFI